MVLGVGLALDRVGQRPVAPVVVAQQLALRRDRGARVGEDLRAGRLLGLRVEQQHEIVCGGGQGHGRSTAGEPSGVRALRADVRQLLVDPVAGVARGDDLRRARAPAGRARPGHRQRRVDRVGQLLDVERVDRQRELAELLVGAGVLGEDRDALALVDDRALLGDQVHAVEHRVDQQHVVVLVGRHRLLEVVAQLQLDRHPVGCAVAVVDDRHERLDPLEVLGVLGHVGARGHQLGDERDALGELGVLLEEQVEGGEAAQHVLGQVGAVDPQDQEVAAAAQQLGLELAHARALSDQPRGLVVDRQRIGPHPHLALAEAHHAALEVDLEVHQVAAALQEVAPVGAGVKADDVVGQQAREDLLADPRRQHPPGVGLRPGDVDEVVQEDVRARAAHEVGQRVEVVVVDHHDRLARRPRAPPRRPARGPR